MRIEIQASGKEYWHLENVTLADSLSMGIGSGAHMDYGVCVHGDTLKVITPTGDVLWSGPLKPARATEKPARPTGAQDTGDASVEAPAAP